VAGANEAIRQAVGRGEHSEGFIVGPTFWHTQQAYETILQFLPRETIKEIYRSPGERRIVLYPDRVVWFKSADNADSLRSKGLDWAWLDEAGLVSEEAWNFLRPALMDRHGIAWFTGTPKGKNLFFKVWQRGQDPQQTVYASWSCPSNVNPYLDQNEIDQFKRDMPQDVFNQEINACFLENVGTVFRNVTSHVDKTITPYVQGQTVNVGCDLAKHQDFTVLAAVRQNGDVVRMDRFGELDWVFQQRRIVEFCRNMGGAALLLDSSGVGDPIFDDLKRQYDRVSGFQFTQASKKELIENLSIMLDADQIHLPNDPVLLSELQLYAYEMTAGGQPKYGAPEGYHDDCVIALALAAWQLKMRPQLRFG